MSDPTPQREGLAEPPAEPLPYLPIFLEVRGRPCLLLGDGEAAAAKAALLLRAGARVRLLAEAPCEALAAELHAGRIERVEGPFTPALLQGAALAIDDGGDEARLARLRPACRAAGVPLNVIDRPAHCDFIVPAILDRSPVVVAVSTGGAAPALARLLRQRLERALPPGLGRLARLAAAFRGRVGETLASSRLRQRFWDRALAEESAAALSALDEADAAARLEALLREVAAGEEAGEVALVDAGPGDPGLLTLAAARAIERADVILHAASVAPATLALARREARLLPLGETAEPALAGRLLRAHAGRGLRVVWLRPSRGSPGGATPDEEAVAALLRRAGLAVRTLPGRSAAAARAA